MPLRRSSEPWLAVALAALLVVGVAAVVGRQPGDRRQAVRTEAVNLRVSPAGRTGAIQALLAARSEAVLQNNKKAFLAEIDPAAVDFRARQSQLIDALRDVPLASWTYQLDAARSRPHTAALDALRGTWWAPDITLRYAIAGYDRSASLAPQGLTFVQRHDRWYLAADDDFAGTGHPTGRDVWDGGRVLSSIGTACLVLSHPQHRTLALALVSECDAAVLRVTAVWGSDWARRVVLVVPDSTAELTRMVPEAGDLSQIAAVATAELVDPSTGYHPVGDRVIVNPANFVDLSAIGRRVVLTHEVTHVASRAVTGPQVPTWFVEGLADYVGYQGANLPLAVSAEELRTDMRAGRLPQHLPLNSAFNGSRKDLAQTYEMSWQAVVVMARTYGQSAMLAVYRDTGADLAQNALARAVAKDLHTSLPAFIAAWIANLKKLLS